MGISIYKSPKKTFTVIDAGGADVAAVKNSRTKVGSGKGTFRVYAGDRIEDFDRRMDALRWAYAQVVGSAFLKMVDDLDARLTNPR